MNISRSDVNINYINTKRYTMFKEKTKSVIIIGAGLAGLTAADEILK